MQVQFTLEPDWMCRWLTCAYTGVVHFFWMHLRWEPFFQPNVRLCRVALGCTFKTSFNMILWTLLIKRRMHAQYWIICTWPAWPEAWTAAHCCTFNNSSNMHGSFNPKKPAWLVFKLVKLEWFPDMHLCCRVCRSRNSQSCCLWHRCLTT